MKRNSTSLLLAIILLVGAGSALAQDSTRGMGNSMPVFSDIDLNGDGAIVTEEFYQARSKRMAERAAKGGKMRNAANAPTFESIDTDSDGKVSAEEFSAHQAEQMAKHRKGKQNKPGN